MKQRSPGLENLTPECLREVVSDLQKIGIDNHFDFCLAQTIIINTFGYEFWAKECTSLGKKQDFFTQKSDTKIIHLADMLWCLKDCLGFNFFLDRGKNNNNFESTYFECYAAYSFLKESDSIEFIIPSQIRGKDFDIKVSNFKSQIKSLNVEVKARKEVFDTDKKLMSFLKQHRNQLPDNQIGAFYLKIEISPESISQKKIIEITQDFLRNTGRVHFVIYCWDCIPDEDAIVMKYFSVDSNGLMESIFSSSFDIKIPSFIIDTDLGLEKIILSHPKRDERVAEILTSIGLYSTPTNSSLQIDNQMFDLQIKENYNYTDWQVTYFRLTAFSNSPAQIIEQNWWKELTGNLPHKKVFECETGIHQEGGVFKTEQINSQLVLTIDPTRINWELFPIPNPYSLNPPIVGTFNNSVNCFLQFMLSWLKNLSNLSVKCLAFAVALIKPVNNLIDGYELLSNYLPSITIDNDSCDFFYQINRPRKLLYLGANELVINRISKWNVSQWKVSNLLINSNPTQLIPLPIEPDSFYVGLELDINTSADFLGDLNSEKLPYIFQQLVELGQEIANKGDIK